MNNPSTWAVWQWPEFKAFIARAGLEGMPIRDMTIRLPMKGAASFEVDTLFVDTVNPNPRLMDELTATPRSEEPLDRVGIESVSWFEDGEWKIHRFNTASPRPRYQRAVQVDGKWELHGSEDPNGPFVKLEGR